MANPLFNSMMQSAPKSGIENLISQIQKFQRGFHGNPQEEVQKLLNSRRITQQQYNVAVQQANEIFRAMGGK